MSSLNKVQLIGNVGKDPEVRAMESGDKVLNMSLATSDRWTDKNTGEKRERTEWHRITVWSQPLIGVIERYVSKGSKIYVQGQLETRKWQDQSGQDRYTTEVVMRPYSSELILLSSGGAKRDAEQGRSDYDTQRPQGGGAQTYGPDGQPTGSATAYGPDGEPRAPADPPGMDLDDEIPF